MPAGWTTVLALLALSLAACAHAGGGAAGPAPGPGPLGGRPWQLVAIRMADGTRLVPVDPALYTLELAAEGRAAMRADCNRAIASYELLGSALAFGPIASTRAMCPPESISDRYLQQLGLVASHRTRDGHLLLATRADGAILEFRRAPP